MGNDSMRDQPGFFDIDDRLKRLSDLGDQLEAFRVRGGFRDVPAGTQRGAFLFERIAGWPSAVRSGDDVQDSCHSGGEQSLRRAHRVPDQRPPVVHAFSWAFLSGSRPRRPHDLAIPREAHESWSIKTLFERFDAMLREVGYIAMSGQIVDASLIAAP